MMRPTTSLLLAGVAGAAFALSGFAQANDMPKRTTWTAYGTASSGYAQSVAIGNMLKKNFDTSMRVIPGKNDISRMAPLRDGKADYCACGIAAYFAQEGVFIFAHKDWGPQPVRLLMSNTGKFGAAVATAKDANIRTIADLKGKRIAWIQGGPALNWNIAAQLAFAGLTWDDVTKVTVSGFGASFDAIINDQADAAFTSTLSPSPKKLAASPRGLYWPQLPHSDAAGWGRTMAVAPYYSKVKATLGSEIDKDNPIDLANYPYPLLIGNATKGEDEVYTLVRAMVDHHDDYKDAAAGAAGWSLDNQKMMWAMPYHDGAIRYWKERGLWSDAAQAHNDELIKRQEVIAAAWNGMEGKDGMEEEALKEAWAQARATALASAGFDSVF